MSDPSRTDPSRGPADSSREADDKRARENEAPARGNETGAWQAPWVASPEHPEGAAAAPVPPQQATGHYGAGYDDPQPHFGNTLPGRPDVDAPGEGGPVRADDADRTSPAARTAPADRTAGPAEAGAARSEEAIRERDAPEGAHHPTEDPERAPDFTPDEVGFRPPDRAPSEEAPASENAGLIFERS